MRSRQSSASHRRAASEGQIDEERSRRARRSRIALRTSTALRSRRRCEAVTLSPLPVNCSLSLLLQVPAPAQRAVDLRLLRVQHQPGGEQERHAPGHGDHVLPVRPRRLHDLIGRGARQGVGLPEVVRDVHRTDLVLHDPARIPSAVAKTGGEQRGRCDVLAAQMQLSLCAAIDRVLDGFVGAGMPAHRIGPHPRPGALDERPAGQQDPSVGPPQVQREGEVTRGLGIVDGGFRSSSAWAARIIQQHHQLWRLACGR